MIPQSEHTTRIGVLGLQGAFAEHHAMLALLGIASVDVRLPEHLDGLDGLIIPGGESTVIGKLMVKYDLLQAVKAFANSGGAIWGTCAGMIMLAQDVGRDQPLLQLLDISVERNAYGSQLFSFETSLDLPNFGIASFPAIFIRAPIVSRVGPGVRVEARDPDGHIVAVSSGALFATSFHPELTNDVRIHAHFVHLATRATASVAAD